MSSNESRHWLTSYPHGIPHDVHPDPSATIVSVLEASVKKYSSKPAFYYLGKSITYAELDFLSRTFASFLRNTLELRKGDRFAIMMPNVLQYPIALFGALRAGLTVVNINPLYTPRELRHQLKDSGAKAVLIIANRGHVLNEVLMGTNIEHVITTKAGDLLPFPKGMIASFVVGKKQPVTPVENSIPFKEILKKGQQADLSSVNVNPRDIAFLQYTGGTTGDAKGAMLTHRNIVVNLEQISAWLKTEEGTEIIITALPLYHIFALTSNCISFVSRGGLNVLIPDARNADAFIKELRNHKFTIITGVNTLFNSLVQHPAIHKVDFSSQKMAIGGGMSVHRSVSDAWKDITGKIILEAYGLTETSPAVTINPPDATEFSGSIGLPIPSTEVSVRDFEGNVLENGSEGELWVRGPQVMLGYYERDEETAQAITPEGWFKTGDIATMDDEGFVRIVDRQKDMILVSGFNVYPNEVEEVLSECPGIVEAACVGIKDERSGEAVKVFVVAQAEGAVTREAIEKHCRENLAAYKIPRHIEFKTELPKTNVGKILRRALREDNQIAE
ncbi:MAG: AMP-binding protein [SAR202 cluster bacterium]|nr:AMP-binding protein [SAR202 cluster bacterium]